MPSKSDPRQFDTQIWICFNHVPGGNIVAQHFETYELTRLGLDGKSEVREFTAKAQAEAFQKSPIVALNINGKIEKNKALVYDGPNLSRNPRAANVVIEWAMRKGLAPIFSPAEKKEQASQEASRVSSLEQKVLAQDIKIDKILEILSTAQKEKVPQ